MHFTSIDLDMRLETKPRDEIFQPKFHSPFLMSHHKNLNFDRMANHFWTKPFFNINYNKNAIRITKLNQSVPSLNYSKFDVNLKIDDQNEHV
jgi:hypothetical protein